MGHIIIDGLATPLTLVLDFHLTYGFSVHEGRLSQAPLHKRIELQNLWLRVQFALEPEVFQVVHLANNPIRRALHPAFISVDPIDEPVLYVQVHEGEGLA